MAKVISSQLYLFVSTHLGSVISPETVDVLVIDGVGHGASGGRSRDRADQHDAGRVANERREGRGRDGTITAEGAAIVPVGLARFRRDRPEEPRSITPIDVPRAVEKAAGGAAICRSMQYGPWCAKGMARGPRSRRLACHGSFLSGGRGHDRAGQLGAV